MIDRLDPAGTKTVSVLRKAGSSPGAWNQPSGTEIEIDVPSLSLSKSKLSAPAATVPCTRTSFFSQPRTVTAPKSLSM